MVINVLKHVVGDQARVLGPVRGRQGDLLHRHLRVPGHLLLQFQQQYRIRVGGGKAAD